jgi:squalene cyclase
MVLQFVVFHEVRPKSSGIVESLAAMWWCQPVPPPMVRRAAGMVVSSVLVKGQWLGAWGVGRGMTLGCILRLHRLPSGQCFDPRVHH